MAYGTVVLTNGVEIKNAPVGFSWTVLFFGGWTCLFRQDWMWGILLIMASLLTWGLAGIVCSFFYNKVYIMNLIQRGFKVQALVGTTDEGLAIYLRLVKIPR